MNDDFLQKKTDALCVLDRLVPLVFDAEKDFPMRGTGVLSMCLAADFS